MRDPLVTICCITYNHESYIRDCIEGFLIQRTSFPIEILIFDDASSDKTQQIIKEYTFKNQNILTFFQNENQWQQKRYGFKDWLLPAAKGKYIALCEGDDYWTDPYKLQKQVDFLEANPEYVASFHKVKILEKSGELVEDYITTVPNKHETIEDLARDGNYIHTPSVVFRNIIKKFPEELVISPVGDYFIYMLLAEHGKFKYLTDTMAIYRNGVGNYSSKTQHDKEISFNITLFLIWHIFIKSNKTVSNILFFRLREKLDQLLRNSDLIYQLTKHDKNQISLIFNLVKQLEYSHQIEIALTKENSINDFLKSTSSFYLLKIVAYKVGLTRLIKKVD